MKKVVVMWLKMADNQELPQFDGAKSEAYHEFFKRADKKFEFYFAFNLDSHLGQGIFRNPAEYKDGRIKFSDKDKVRADVIYHYNFVAKDPGFDPSPALIINSVSFKSFGGDKIEQYKLLESFFPNTKFLPDIQSVKKYVASKNNDDMVVLKPVKGSSGEGVVISPKESVNYSEINKELLESSGYMGQEFIDTSSGIPGITTGIHDLRIITMINDIVLCHVRTPEDSSKIANTHRGASMKEFFFKDFPAEIQDFYGDIHDKIKTVYGKILYSMDLGLGADGKPLLFEINSHTAFPRKDFKVFDLFIDTLVRVLDDL